ncbi:MAG TPA: glycosyltransferase [Rhodocyclaceae bacterium]|nr:glycosyltransferase [Rhodocyclaceae bacterium]
MRTAKLEKLPIRQSRKVYDHKGNILVPAAVAQGALPKISIVTPSFNQGDFLEECILSVLEQGYPNLEFIIVDGGSTDQSVEIIKKYERYLAYWQSGNDGGRYRAIETGLQRATGEIQAWLNPHAKYHPGALKTVAETFMRYPEVEWLTGRPTTWNAKGELIDIGQLQAFSLRDYLDPDQDHFIRQESVFWRKALWDRAGGRFDPSLNCAGDMELWLRYFEQSELHIIDALLGGSRHDSSQKATTASIQYRQEAHALRQRPWHAKRQAPLPHWEFRGEIATSLIPNNVAGQLPAIKSWQKLGFEVTSINPPEELPLLKEHYPGVRFVTAPRNGRALVGKPCVFIDDILEHFKSSDADFFGIVNSDIFLCADDDLVDVIGRNVTDSLVYGSRVEIKRYGSALGRTYHYGFDYFFFDQRLLDVYPKSRFMLGIPWWDYWFPFYAGQAGIPIKRLDSYLAFHISHPINYQFDHILTFKKHFLELAGNPELRQVDNRILVNPAAKDADKRIAINLEHVTDMVRQMIERYSTSLSYDNPYTEFTRIGLGAPMQSAPYRVSAIVSTYASESFIRGCLENLLSQTIAGQIEIIVIDANSPEDEKSIVEEFQARHGNIRYVRTQERIGVYAAWNMAARMATGAYLVSCSTNDRLRPNALEIMARVLDEEPEIAITYGHSYLSRKPHENWENFAYSGEYMWPEYSYRSLLASPAVGPHPMWRRRLHDELGYFNEEYAAISDQDFWLRVGTRYTMRSLSDFTGLYLVSEDSLSGNKTRAQMEYRQIAEPHRRAYAYNDWLEGRYFTTGMGRCFDALLDDRPVKPAFTYFIRHTSPGFEALATTIRSLTSQLYAHLKLVVLSPVAAPPGIVSDRIGWAKCPVDEWAAAVNQVLPKVAPGDGAQWFSVLQDGDELVDRALLVFAETIHNHPDLRILYCDEDETAPITGLATPHFKPPFDPDRLLATPYIGETLVLNASYFLEQGGFEPRYPGAEHYAFLLRTLEGHTPEVIGQVADALLHRPTSRYSPLPNQAHVQAVVDHLTRRNIDASIEFDSQIPLRILYHLEQDRSAPQGVGIVFYSSSGDVKKTEQSIVCLLETTPPTPITLYLIDPGPSEPAISAFLAQVGGLGLPNIRTIPTEGGSLESALQTALEYVKEPYTLLWSDEARANEANWLANLLARFNRPEPPAAVGPRLANAAGQIVSAGEEPGLNGPTGSPYKGISVNYPGDGATLLAEHRVEALDKRCLLIRTELAKAAGGIRPDAYPTLWAADLCLRIGENHPLLWTPAVTIVVDESQVELEEDDQRWRKKDRYRLDSEQLDFYRTWGHRLGHSISRNSNIALGSRDYVPETRSALTYDPLFGVDLPRIYAHVADFDGCGNYRILQPMKSLLSNARVRGGVATDPLPPASIAAGGFDTYVFQRPHSEAMLDALKAYKALSPALRIFEVDDLLSGIPASSPHAKDFGPEVIERVQQAIQLCDRLVVSTESLAAAYGKFAPEVRVQPNYLPNAVWDKVAPLRRHSGKPRVGWAGSISHLGDLELLSEVVPALADEVDWVFFGACRREILPYVAERFAAVSFEAYPETLARMDLDLALAPLVANAFNEAKTPLKLMEYGILGYPVVCSDVGPYRQGFPVTRVANTPKAWIAAIRERIRDRTALCREGDALQAHIRRHWMLDDHLDEWRAAWTR